jgi:hypothetical protein
MILTLSHRAPRRNFDLPAISGVYAHFVKPGIIVAGLEPGEDGIIYVGRTEAGTGFRGRDHYWTPFTNSTVRQSLAALLIDELWLIVLPYRRTWTIDDASDVGLKEWMHAHLLLAIEPRDDAPLYEQRMIWHYKPPLNLKDCPQSPAHGRLSQLRRKLALRCRRDSSSEQSG